MNNRLIYVDAIKGLGILIMMLAHSSFEQGQVSNVLLFSWYIGMFFIVSGFVSKKYLFSKVLKKKGERLLVPYFLYGIVTVTFFSLFIPSNSFVDRIIGLIYSRFALYPFGTHDNLLFLQECSPFWFLTCLFISYVYVSIVDQTRSSTWRCIIILLYILGACTSINLPILLPWSMETAFLGALFILTGRFVRNFEVLRLIDKNKWCFCILFVVFLCLADINGWPNVSVRDYGNYIILYYMVSLSATITILYALYKMPPLLLMPLSILGNYSLRIMCLHAPFFIILSTLNNKYQIFSNQNTFAVIEIVVALLFVELFSRLLNNLRVRFPQVPLFAYL